MAGRLGMTGSGVARGDSAVGKAISKPMAVRMAGPMKASQQKPLRSRQALINDRHRAAFNRQNRAGEVVPRTMAGVEFRRNAGKIMGNPRPLRSWNPSDGDPRMLYERQRGRKVMKLDTTMTDRQAAQMAARYDTRGPLPKTLSRDERMKAYEARYVASGGKKADKWKRRADHAEAGRNIGLAGATAAGGAILARKAPGLRRIKPHRLETAAVASGVLGGASELYGEHARSRRASYQNSPAGVAASALSRMRAYTPGGN